ncbi:hypothetical protein [Cytobacillus pseudoceanisediminis]|uniref:hypothetical protein n=1 Tax=Cytobacillus pseudoceanisediminis TaxID=3051614 RepID=UPI003C2BEF4C
MVNEETVLKIVKDFSQKEEVELDSFFSDLELDSTNLVEILIELEILLDVDLMTEDLNLDGLLQVKDFYEYANYVVKKNEG